MERDLKPEDNLKYVESDFAEFRKQEIRKRNNTNRQRSRNQERQIAKYLGGQRIPMSGAGMLKGDGLWNSPLGLIVYECKYSAAHNPTYGKALRFQHEWIEKHERDMKSMGTDLGFIVISFFNQVGGVVWSTCFLNEHVAGKILEQEWIEAAPKYEVIKPAPWSTPMFYTHVRLGYKLNPFFPCQWIDTQYGKQIMIPLWAFRQRVYDVTGGPPKAE